MRDLLLLLDAWIRAGKGRECRVYLARNDIQFTLREHTGNVTTQTSRVIPYDEVWLSDPGFFERRVQDAIQEMKTLVDEIPKNGYHLST